MQRVTFPLPGPSADGGEAAAGAGRGNRILVVDDEATIRRLFQRVLQHARFDAVTAAGGAEGLQRLREDPAIGLVLLDLMMPDMDGWRFRHAQRADPRLARIPTIVVTGAETGEAVRDALRASGYVRKPVTAEQLVAAVSAFCTPSP